MIICVYLRVCVCVWISVLSLSQCMIYVFRRETNIRSCHNNNATYLTPTQ